MSSDTKKKSTVLPIVLNFSAASISGVIDRFTVHGPNTIRVRMMSNGTPFGVTFGEYAKQIRIEGMSRYFNGIGPSLIEAAGHRGAKFGLLFSLTPYMPEGLHPVSKGMLGTVAIASLEMVVLSPLDLMKVRMQQTSSSLTVTPAQALLNSVKADGVTSIWKGCTSYGMRAVGFNVTALPVAFSLDQKLGIKKNEKSAKKFISGAVSGFVGSFSSNPFDVANSRIKADPTNPNYRSLISTVLHISKTEGATALMRGVFPKSIEKALSIGIVWASFPVIRSMFDTFDK